MHLPQPTLHSRSGRSLHCLTIAAALLLASVMPKNAGADARQLACSPSTLHFGQVDTGQTETLLVTLTNSGESSVTISSMSVSNSSFAASSLGLPLTLMAGQSVDLNVSFAPAAAGWNSGTVKFSSDGANPTLDLSVVGTGVSSEALTASPSTLSFGSVAMGSTLTLPVVLTNARTRKVTLSSFQTTVSEFSTSGATFPLTLSPGQSVTLNVTFTPQSQGEVGGSLFVYGPGLSIPLTGTGTAMQYSVSLGWNASDDVEGYNIYRSTSASGSYSKINSTLNASTAYTDGTVLASQTYYYEVTSVNFSGQESARSTPAVEAVVP
jgi:hypothetical protein